MTILELLFLCGLPIIMIYWFVQALVDLFSKRDEE